MVPGKPPGSACSVHSTRPIDEAKIRELNLILSHTTNASRWWTQHTPLQTIVSPFGRNCRPRRPAINGCQPRDPAYIRCSSEPNANRAAVPFSTGSWPLCDALLLPPGHSQARSSGSSRSSSSGSGSASRSIAYSFGIANQWRFDDTVAAKKGFTVHSFDPTTRFRKAHTAHRKSNVHFHYWGLSTSNAACRDGNSKDGGASYGGLGGEMLSLSQIRSRLGHGNGTRISTLKIDCEGCEVTWRAAQGADQSLSALTALL